MVFLIDTTGHLYVSNDVAAFIANDQIRDTFDGQINSVDACLHEECWLVNGRHILGDGVECDGERVRRWELWRFRLVRRSCGHESPRVVGRDDEELRRMQKARILARPDV